MAFLRSRACAVLATAVLAGGCGSGDDWSRPHAAPAAVGTLGPGFYDAETPPVPESTIIPRPGSWDGVHPAKGYRVVLLTAGADRPTRTLAEAGRRGAGAEEVSLKTVSATAPDRLI